MAESIRRPAVSFHWIAPDNTPCSLSPMSGGQGMLEIEIMGGMAIVHSRSCLLVKRGEEEEFIEVGEFEVTLCLSRCQIHWHYTEKAEEDTVERSQYFTQ